MDFSFLTEEEVKRIIDNADTLQRKALIATAYETGSRPEELLNLRIRDIAFDQYGCTVILEARLGRRGLVRMIAYAKGMHVLCLNAHIKAIE